MKPTIGRIVLYNHEGLNGLPKEQYPAIVQCVMKDGSLRLVAFGPYDQCIRYDVTQGDEPGQWNWPPRV